MSSADEEPGFGFPIHRHGALLEKCIRVVLHAAKDGCIPTMEGALGLLSKMFGIELLLLQVSCIAVTRIIPY